MKTVFGSEIINFIKIIKDIKGNKIDKGNSTLEFFFKSSYYVQF